MIVHEKQCKDLPVEVEVWWLSVELFILNSSWTCLRTILLRVGTTNAISELTSAQ